MLKKWCTMIWVPGTMPSPHHPPQPSYGQTTHESSQSKFRSVLQYLNTLTYVTFVIRRFRKWKLLSRVRLFVTPWTIQNSAVGSLSLLQGVFPTQGLNAGLPHCRQILYQLSHQGSPRILEWVVYPFSSRSSWPRNQTGVSSLQADSLPTELPGKPWEDSELWAIKSFRRQLHQHRNSK